MVTNVLDNFSNTFNVNRLALSRTSKRVRRATGMGIVFYLLNLLSKLIISGYLLKLFRFLGVCFLFVSFIMSFKCEQKYNANIDKALNIIFLN